MRTIFVTGNDTGIGKTWAAAALAREYAQAGGDPQMVKVVETGVAEPRGQDAPGAARAAGLPATAAHTLFTFAAPLAPLEAARRAGVALTLDQLVAAYEKLPPAGVRIVEGAGGLAVPVGPGDEDWADFVHRVPVDRVILVVEDRLGAIHQGRVLAYYARSRGLDAVLLLNEARRQNADVRESNQTALLRAGFPLVGQLGFDQGRIEWRPGGRELVFG